MQCRKGASTGLGSSAHDRDGQLHLAFSVPAAAVALDSVMAVDAVFAAGMNAKDTAAVYAADAKLMPRDSPILDGAAAHPVIAGLIAGGASHFVLTPTTAYCFALE